jgi:MFS family permease
MTETIKKSLRESKAARWTALIIVSFTMLCGYYLADVMAPLKGLLESQLTWTGDQYGFFTSAYGWFNVFLFFLIIGGIILDRMGVRFTGLMATLIMLLGIAIKYWAVSTHMLDGQVWKVLWFNTSAQVFIAGIGFAIFGVGVEVAGITVSKIIVKWFKGKELALAMGLEMAMARIGTGLAIGTSLPVAKWLGHVSMPLLLGLIMACIGVIAFVIYIIQDKKLDASEAAVNAQNNVEAVPEESFRLRDILFIVTNKAWWYIAILCVLFYSAVFPFLKYATDLMIQKFMINEDWAGSIPALLPFGTILLTPLFGNLYDRKGKGASIMIIGACLLIFVHAIFSIPALDYWFIALLLILILGIGFSLVPSAMWPSVPKIIPEKQLGTAYSMIFWVQNWGLMGVPALIGWVLSKYSFIGYFAILGTGFITNQGDEITQITSTNHEIHALSTAGSVSRKDTTIQVSQFLKDADGNIISILLATNDTILRSNVSNKAFKKVQTKNEVKVPLYSFKVKGAADGKDEFVRVENFVTNQGERVTKFQNVASFYNYTKPMMIFTSLGLLALIFAFLLKAEDRKKGYGLQMPNIQKLIEP